MSKVFGSKRTVLLLASVVALVVPKEEARAAFPGINGKIVFVRDPDGYQGKADPEIYTISFRGDNLKRLTNNSTPDSDPSWSADGKKIVFESGHHLYTINANGSHLRKVTNLAYAGYLGGDPSFLPSGRKIAFSSSRDADADLYIMDADGTDVRQLTNNPAYDTLPDWQPIQ